MKVTRKQLRRLIEATADGFGSYSMTMKAFDTLLDGIESIDVHELSPLQVRDILRYQGIRVCCRRSCLLCAKHTRNDRYTGKR